MNKWLAIVAYQCQVNGVSTGSVDFQVRYFNLCDAADVVAALRSEPSHAYRNHLDEMVVWPIVEIFAVERLKSHASGDEVIGFIAGTEELASLGGPDAVQQFTRGEPGSRVGTIQS